jgi:AbrB family looped-hinge helix DNA binding protein
MTGILAKSYQITGDHSMKTATVTSRGRVTIPKALRQRLGIRLGSKVVFSLKDDHVEIRAVSAPTKAPSSGFGILKSQRAPVPVDFDTASLL